MLIGLGKSSYERSLSPEILDPGSKTRRIKQMYRNHYRMNQEKGKTRKQNNTKIEKRIIIIIIKI